MMTLSRGFRGDAGAPKQMATHVAAAALIVTTVPTANVPRAADGPAGALANISARTLGADGRLMEIRSLGDGWPRPNGGVGEGMTIMADGWRRFSPLPGS